MSNISTTVNGCTVDLSIIGSIVRFNNGRRYDLTVKNKSGEDLIAVSFESEKHRDRLHNSLVRQWRKAAL